MRQDPQVAAEIASGVQVLMQKRSDEFEPDDPHPPRVLVSALAVEGDCPQIKFEIHLIDSTARGS